MWNDVVATYISNYLKKKCFKIYTDKSIIYIYIHIHAFSKRFGYISMTINQLRLIYKSMYATTALIVSTEEILSETNFNNL